MYASIRAFLLVNGLAIAAVAAAALLLLGLPLAARHALTAPALFAVAGAVALLVALVATLLLVRGVARPLDRLLLAAGRLGTLEARGAGELPLLGERGGYPLSRAALAFERLALAFGEERVRLADKVKELTEANRALELARESLVRSEKLATVGRLAAGLAHEVGNPLGAIAGYLEIARSRLPAGAHPDLKDALRRIGLAAERIDRTVRDLLDFARPAPPVLAPLSLPSAVEAAVRLARVQTRFREVELAIELPGNLPRVIADEHYLAQVLLNLLLNAGDALEGEGQVRLSARVLGEGAQVALSVEDSGPGIPDCELPRIFDPFYTTKEPGAGTGLGLAICHRIMESFGGEITARNGARRGAVFELRFRAAP
ncbi:MAG TPA: ATP-binding protein [Anaeromyxobacteraceae bacterium]|nr:ATP-binding protein [Anaeromyxobacteraceae bacterium]